MGDEKIPSRAQYIDAFFGAGGMLSREIDGYTPRPGQIQLARSVDRAIAQRTHLIAEGPTGTGKSLAYAVPASYEASTTGKAVVIVTANIALQEQIVTKDLPLLKKVAPWPFTFALMKGRNNYLCVDRYLKGRSDTTRYGDGNLDAERRRQLNVLNNWAETAVRNGVESGERGDMTELPFEPDGGLWKRFSVTGEECKKGKCRHADDCFSQFALGYARQAKVVVTNYHMLFAHLSVYADTGLDVVLPPFEICILDEAHKAPDIARDFFGFKIGEGAIKRLARRVRGGDMRSEMVSSELERASGAFFYAMSLLKRDRERYKARIVSSKLYQKEIDVHRTLDVSLTDAISIFASREATARAAVEQMQSAGMGMSDRARDLGDELAELELDTVRAQEIRSQLGDALGKQNPRSVYFLEEMDREGRGPVSVCSKLVHAKDALGPYLFHKRVGSAPDRDKSKAGDAGAYAMGDEEIDAYEKAHVEPSELDPFADADLKVPEDEDKRPKVSVIATSATLATDGGSFEYAADELGCTDYDQLVAESPFDWPNQCLFVCPEGMKDPNDKEFADAVAKMVERTVLLARGRTLGLFTSRRVLNHTYDAIVGSCRAHGYTLLKQGDAPRSKLIAQFKNDVSSVLLGTESFWAGVDVPGEALSAVVIDRLPFPTPDDPVLDVISSEDDKWFWKYSIPRAIIQLKQGFGRLIRSMKCKGVVVCLDNRIVTKKYGRQFLRALPNVPKSTRIESIAEWLEPEPAWDAPAAPTKGTTGPVHPDDQPIEVYNDDEIPF